MFMFMFRRDSIQVSFTLTKSWSISTAVMPVSHFLHTSLLLHLMIPYMYLTNG